MKTPLLLPENAKPQDAVEWVRAQVDLVGLGYHPDTPYRDYVVCQTGEPTFTAEQADAMEESRAIAFGLLGDRIYEVALAHAYPPFFR